MVVYPVKHVSWEEVVEWSFRLADKVRASGFRPDVVVAVGRGGYVVSRLICDSLDIDKLVALPIRWSSGRSASSYLADLIRCFHRFKGFEVGACIAEVVKNLRIEIPIDVRIELNGLRALAVEEISATGMHLAKAKELLSTWGAQEVKGAVLVWKASTSSMRPDYTFIETPSFVWFQFPWSRVSDYVQFAMVAIEESLGGAKDHIFNLEYVEKLFIEWYGFKPDYKYLKRALEKLVEVGFLKRSCDGKYALTIE
jgi:hypoxanthine phosphoribosyltransferase